MKKYILFAAGAMVLASCSSDEPGQGGASSSGGAAVVTADIGSLSSRASDAQWGKGDCIGISGSTGSVDYVNVPYATYDGNGIFESLNGVANGIFFQDNQPATFSAYYPYSADVTAGNTLITASTANQALDDTFDFLFASGATGSLSEPVLKFSGDASFKHRMAQLMITLTIDSDGGFSDNAGLVAGNSKITLDGIALEGEFDTATGIAAATGSADELSVYFPHATSNTTVYTRLILFPQTVGDVELNIEYEGSTYSCTFSPTLAAGKRYTANVTLRKTGLTVGSAEITGWEDNDPIFGDASSYDPFNGHEAVLMRKATSTEPALYVATCNIGANHEKGVGTYFWWGDVVGHASGFDKDNADIITNSKTRKQLFEEGFIDANGNLLPQYDAAAVNWGGRWRLPTHEDWAWIGDTGNCTWILRADSGFYWEITSKSTGGVIYLRLTGYIDGADNHEMDNMTVYGGATVFPEDGYFNVNNDRFYGISMHRSAHNGSHDATRTNGLNLRPVVTF